MRVAKNKSALKNHVIKAVPSKEESSGKTVADEGALLWCCNWSKNEKFVSIFQKYVGRCRHLKINGFEVILCPSDADTTIVKTALAISDEPVTVMSDDTDIMVLLLHHVYFHHPDCNIFLKSMKTQNDTEKRLIYSINDIIASCDKVHIQNILFAHSFTGYDTTTSIYRF